MSIENEATTAGDPSLTPQTTPTDMSEEDREMMEAEEVARRAQYGQTGDMLDTTMGGLGGAGASGSGPDIGQQSSPAPGNHSDMPAGSRWMAGNRTDEVDAGAANRGTPAHVASSGQVSGAGAGAGGGGAPEEIDADSANGATGNEQPRTADLPHVGGDASNHGGR